MKLIKTISIGLCLTAFTFAAQAQQQTTSKTQGETPATPTSDLKKKEDEKRPKRDASTLTLTERNAAARRHKTTNANGASPNLNDSREAKANGSRNTNAADNTNSAVAGERPKRELEKPQQNADGTRHSTGKRENNPNAAE